MKLANLEISLTIYPLFLSKKIIDMTTKIELGRGLDHIVNPIFFFIVTIAFKPMASDHDDCSY